SWLCELCEYLAAFSVGTASQHRGWGLLLWVGYSRRVTESIPHGKPFHIPEDLHPANVPLAFLLGRWEGRGKGDYPTIEPFDFGQEVVFSHNQKPFLYYTSRSWLLDDEGNAVEPLAMETGFWRPQSDGGVELVLSHPTGYAEIW